MTGVNIDHRFCQHHQSATLTVAGNTFSSIDVSVENKEVLDELTLAEYINNDGRYDENLCNVFRSGINNKSKISTYGFLSTVLNCSLIVGFTEQPCAKES